MSACSSGPKNLPRPQAASTESSLKIPGNAGSYLTLVPGTSRGWLAPPGNLYGRAPCKLLGTQGPVSTQCLPASKTPVASHGHRQFLWSWILGRLPQIQIPGLPQCLPAPVAPGTSPGSRWLQQLQALRGSLRTGSQHTWLSASSNSPKLLSGRSWPLQLQAASSAQLQAPRKFLGALIHSSTSWLPQPQATPVASGFWPMPVQADTRLTTLSVGSCEPILLTHPNSS